MFHTDKGSRKEPARNPGLLARGLFFGFLVGIAIGLFGLGWGLWPVTLVDFSPEQLREDFRMFSRGGARMFQCQHVSYQIQALIR